MNRFALMLLFISSTCLADGAAEYKYREGVMEAIEGHMGAITAIVRTKVHQQDLALHTKSLAELAKLVPSIFPEGSKVGKTEALPEIWQDPDAFKIAVDGFIEAAAALHQVVEDDTDVRSAFRNVAQSCKNCHDDFREEP